LLIYVVLSSLAELVRPIQYSFGFWMFYSSFYRWNPEFHYTNWVRGLDRHLLVCCLTTC